MNILVHSHIHSGGKPNQEQATEQLTLQNRPMQTS